MDSCHAGPLYKLDLSASRLLGEPFRCSKAEWDFAKPFDPPGGGGRPYLAYVRSWTSPRKPERRSARVRMAMPVAYVYVFVLLTAVLV